GTTYQYTVDNSTKPASFCLTGINGTRAYYVTEEGVPTEGTCSGHNGPVIVDPPASCEPGYIPVPGNIQFGTNGFCVAKYEAKNVGGVAISQAAGAPWVEIAQVTATTVASNACDGCHLITEAEWLTIAHNVLSVDSNWSGDSVGS